MIVATVSASKSGPHGMSPNAHPKEFKAFGSLFQNDKGFFAVVMAIANLFFAFGAHPW